VSIAAESSPSRPRLRFTPRAAILALVLTALLVSMAVPLRTYLQQRTRVADLQRQTQLLQRQNADLQRQVQQLGDPRYIERIARECLGMVRPGEIGFVVVPQSGPPRPPAC
jgi:cell division protein FtsL